MKSEMTLDELGPSHTITYTSAGPGFRRIEGRYTPITDEYAPAADRFASPKEALAQSAVLRLARLKRKTSDAKQNVARLRLAALLRSDARAVRRTLQAALAENTAEIAKVEMFLQDLQAVEDPHDFATLNRMITGTELGVDEIVPAPTSFRFSGSFLPVGTPIYGVRFDHFGAPRMLEGKVTGFSAQDVSWFDGPFIYFFTEMGRGDSDGTIDTNRTVQSSWVPAMASETGYSLAIHGHLFFLDRKHALACALSKIDALAEDLRELRYHITK